MDFEMLLHRFHSDLKEIKKQNPEIITQANQAIRISRKTLSDMSHMVSTTCFMSENDEIDFFKRIKSQPLNQLIYFSEIRSMEIQFPKASVNSQKKYVKHKIRKANKFFNYNIEFVQYVRNRRNHYDALYFTRKNYNSLTITDTKNYYRAPEFSTSHDILYAKVKAFDLFSSYLQNRLHNLMNPSTQVLNMHKRSRLKWTSSKVALTELIYALHSSGAINSGAVDLKEIASITERIFNIELGDYYRTYLEIKMRKNGRTKFLDTLKSSLERRIQDSEM